MHIINPKSLWIRDSIQKYHQSTTSRFLNCILIAICYLNEKGLMFHKYFVIMNIFYEYSILTSDIESIFFLKIKHFHFVFNVKYVWLFTFVHTAV